MAQTKELVVQRLSTTVSGKAQKYTRVAAREFVPFDYDEVNISNIKKACSEHYGRLYEQCPHCSQTCTKLFNLRRHIARVHKNVENKKNETTPPTGRCVCLNCEFKCHKIKGLRNHLQKAHGVEFNTRTTNFNTNTGM
jgi:hypothetical protein